MSSIFNITQEYLELLKDLEDKIELIDFETQDLEVAAKDELEALKLNEEALEAKVKAYDAFIKMKKADIQIIDDEINRLQKLKVSRTNLIDRLKDAVNEILPVYGKQGNSGNFSLKYDTLTVYNVYHKPLILDDEFNKPEYGNYTIKEKLTKNQLDTVIAAIGEMDYQYVPDKVKIKYYLKEGVEIDGARLDNNASYIIFK